jgi:hypothetical protein
MLKFIDDCKRWYRMWSVQFAALAATMLAYAAANPQPVLDLLASIPEEWSWVKPVAVFVVTFGVPVLLRVLKQSAFDKESE